MKILDPPHAIMDQYDPPESVVATLSLENAKGVCTTATTGHKWSKISPITTLYIGTHPQPDPSPDPGGVPGASGASLDPYCRGVPTRKRENSTKNPLSRGV
jgi:hypothetical protein